MNVQSGPAGASSAKLTPRPPLWLFGWWAAGRVIVLVTALSTATAIRFRDSDGSWYREVARSGYLVVAGRWSDTAFFPFYPILLRAVHALGVGWDVVGPLVSNLALLFGLGLFYLLTRELFDADLARRAATYLAIFPLGYVFSMTYPESVVLVLVAAAPLAALRRRWWLAAICAAAATLARPEGIFIALPLAGIAWKQRRSLTNVQGGAALAAVLAPFAALASFSFYLGTIVHDPLAWSHAQSAWGRQFRISGAVQAFAHLPAALTQNPWLARDLACFFLYLGLLYAASRLGTPITWLAAAAAVVVLPVFTGTFQSLSRFGLLAPPLFWGLASLGKNPTANRALQAGSLLLLIVGTISVAYAFP